MADDLPTANAFPTSTKPMPAVARFEAVIVEAKLTQKGEWALTLKIPWSDRDSAVELADKHGVMLDWRVSSKPGG